MSNRRTQGGWLWAVYVGCLSQLAGCSLAPAYKVPDVAPSGQYKEVAPADTNGTWEQGVPADAQTKGEWWKIFQDTTLDGLETQALEANQDLKAAAARVQEARALERTARSEWFPQIGAGFGPARQLNAPDSLGVLPGSNPSPQTVWRAQLSISYEADIFGRVASQAHAAKAESQASLALYQSVRLLLEADVAQNYFTLRELDAEKEVIDRTVHLRQEALDFAQHRLDAGDVSELDVDQAKAELESTRSDYMTVARERAASEHRLAVLVGKAPADFNLAASPIIPVDIAIPPGLPSSLLQRRPDVAAAERTMAAANARIGVARAAYFPSLNLTAEGGYESSSLNNLFKLSNRAFLLGPLVGTPLFMTLFDGGQRRGNLENAKAKYQEDVALYRQQVLHAFQEVEDGLTNVQILRDQTRVEDSAVDASARAARLSRTQYEEGQVAYIDVLDTERTLLQARRQAIQLRGAQAVSTVQLIRALGGGWSTEMMPPSTAGTAPHDHQVANASTGKGLPTAVNQQ